MNIGGIFRLPCPVKGFRLARQFDSALRADGQAVLTQRNRLQKTGISEEILHEKEKDRGKQDVLRIGWHSFVVRVVREKVTAKLAGQAQARIF